jgi:hypothetical protein
LYFPEENTKQLDQNKIIEVLDQAKAPEWHEEMGNANMKPNLDPERSLWPSCFFLKKLMHLKGN